MPSIKGRPYQKAVVDWLEGRYSCSIVASQAYDLMRETNLLLPIADICRVHIWTRVGLNAHREDLELSGEQAMSPIKGSRKAQPDSSVVKSKLRRLSMTLYKAIMYPACHE